jgi:DNA-binding HxlR family transcriptional regulator
MKTPKIGSPVRGSKTGRPVMVAMDLLGRRTAMRILWELREAPLTFRALQEACETNSRLLNMRLTELKDSGIVEHATGGYRLTELGQGLVKALEPFYAWAEEWAQHVAAYEA